jgi:hypothetical protein
MKAPQVNIKNTLAMFALYAATVILDLLLLSVFMRLNFLRSFEAIFLYRMMYYIIIASLILFAVFMITSAAAGKKLERLLPEAFRLNTIISAVIIGALFTAFFAGLGPQSYDRSYTIYTLANMYENPDTRYTVDDVEAAFIDGFIRKYGQTKRRVEEQQSIGDIEEVEPGKFRITERGGKLIKMMRLVEKFYPADSKSSLYPQGNVE